MSAIKVKRRCTQEVHMIKTVKSLNAILKTLLKILRSSPRSSSQKKAKYYHHKKVDQPVSIKQQKKNALFESSYLLLLIISNGYRKCIGTLRNYMINKRFIKY